jgi:putative NADPH-quinone reductase
MKKRRKLVVIQGHPDPAGGHLCHALADAYADGARSAGAEVTVIDTAALDLPLLDSQRDWIGGPPPPGAEAARDAIGRADHLFIVYPLWLGTMPARLKAFLEQVARPGPGGALVPKADGKGWTPGWRGKSARVVVTMGMPALAYRLYFGGHSLKSLERNILRFVGIRPVRDTVLGLVETAGKERKERWLAKMSKLGQRLA